MLGLNLYKIKKGITIVNAFQSILCYIIQKENQTKYRLIWLVNFITIILKNV